MKKNKVTTETEGLNHILKDGSMTVEESNYGRILWTILNVELWHRIFIDRAFDSILENQKIPIHD